MRSGAAPCSGAAAPHPHARQPAPCRPSRATCHARRPALRVLCTSTLPTPPTQPSGPAPSSSSSSNGASHAAAKGPRTGPTPCLPEDMVLPPGALSTIDRVGKGLDADVFRCFGCTKPECQARGMRACHPCLPPPPSALCLHWASLHLATLGAPAFLQGPTGCAASDWRFSLDGYLREILTARVYDVAVGARQAPALAELCAWPRACLCRSLPLQMLAHAACGTPSCTPLAPPPFLPCHRSRAPWTRPRS